MFDDRLSDAPRYASIGDILGRALDAYLPPEAIRLSEHAAKTRWLNNQGGGYVGRWSNDEAPFLVGPMDALDIYKTVVVPGPGRSGKTTIAENWLLKSVDVDPADILWYEPTDDLVEAYVKSVINPMIEQHRALNSKLGPLPIHRSLHFKQFREMSVQFLAMTDNNLRNKSAARIVIDETDAMADSLGDVYDHADLRRQSFGDASRILAISHPDKAIGLDPRGWHRGIMRLYGQSTRCVWYWPCPHCNDFSSPHPLGQRVMELHYPEAASLDEIREATTLICPSCDSMIADKHRRSMNLDGKWVGQGQIIDPDGTVSGTLIDRPIAGFHIVGLMSPFVIGGIGALAAAKVDAERKREATGDAEPLKVVMARRFGLPYDPLKQSEQIDATTLANRAEDRPLKTVPVGARFLTAFVDVQKNRFEPMVRAWGVGGESWVIDVEQIPADTGVSPADWDALLHRLIGAAYPLEGDPARGMKIRAIGFDSAGAPGVTQEAYAAWRRLKRDRKVQFAGKRDGRDCWTVQPMKGASGSNAARMQIVYPNSKRKDRDARATGSEPLLLFAPDRFKDDLGGMLAKADPGPLYIHFPRALRGAWPSQTGPEAPDVRHAWFEQVVAEAPDHAGRWKKVAEAARNEALDQLVGTHVLADLWGLNRIDWDRPPNWAAEWDTNVLIQPISAHETATVALRRTPVPAVLSKMSTAPARIRRPAAALDHIAALLRR
jgi:phage terminase large subunit GpA-like protein